MAWFFRRINLLTRYGGSSSSTVFHGGGVVRYQSDIVKHTGP